MSKVDSTDAPEGYYAEEEGQFYCQGCQFNSEEISCPKNDEGELMCFRGSRKDETSVIFKKFNQLERIGDPLNYRIDIEANHADCDGKRVIEAIIFDFYGTRTISGHYENILNLTLREILGKMLK